MNKAVELLKQQQTGQQEGSPAWAAAQQLIEICEREPYSASLVEKDLENPKMSIAEAEKTIRDIADRKHRENGGNFAFVSPKEAEEALRKFYGLPETGVQESAGGIALDLEDFL